MLRPTGAQVVFTRPLFYRRYGPLGLYSLNVPGNGKQGEFDRVHGKYDAQGHLLELIIVECKGGSSTLGCSNRNQQGGTRYLLDVVDNMSVQGFLIKMGG